MKKSKIVALTLVTALALSVAPNVNAAESPQAGPAASAQKNVKTDGSKATVNTNENGTAAISGVKSSKKSVVVAATVKVDGVKYSVTVIETGAFLKCKKATKIVLPASTKLIKKKAFTGAKKLKTVVFKGKKVVKVKKGAFNGLATKKVTIKVNKKMSKSNFKKFKKALKKAGFKGKIKRG